MARIGYQYSGPSGPGKFPDIQTLFSNLTTWTVSAPHTFGTGTTERIYLVLTSTTSASEILVVIGNGSNVYLSQCIHASFALNGIQTVSGARVPLSLGFALQGGYAASFAAAKDPINADFFPAISTRFVPVTNWNNSTTSRELLLLEDPSNQQLHFLSGNTTNQGYDCWSYAEDLIIFDRNPNDPSKTWSGSSVIWTGPTSSSTQAPYTISKQFMWYHHVGQTTPFIEELEDRISTGILDFLTDTLQPDSQDNTWQATRCQAQLTQSTAEGDPLDYSTYIGQMNPNYYMTFSSTTNAFKRKLSGSSAGDSTLTHIVKGELWPWASNLGDPL